MSPLGAHPLRLRPKMQQHTSIRAAGPSIDAGQIPVLETPRLRLRAFELRDLPAACAMWSTPEVVQYIGGKARSEAEVWATISRSFGHWALLGYGYLAIEDRGSRRYLGQVGLMEGLRDVSPSFVGTPEAGWALAHEAWGKGVATEALGALVGWADRALSVGRTVCIMSPENLGSVRVASKCGYKRTGRVRLDGAASDTFERSAVSDRG